MGTKVKTAASDPAAMTDDFWPLVVEFMISQKAWWISMCAEFELTAVQGHALRTLDPERPVAMSTLADALVCDASNVTGIVDKLESRGLIARQSAEHDRRIKMLAVTEKGRQLRERLTARMMDPPQAVGTLSPETRRRLTEFFRAVMVERGLHGAALRREG
jgi:DNA-binding MarR family transcriptional regulator